MNKQTKLAKKDKRQNAENRSFDRFCLRFCGCHRNAEMLVDFSYHPQIHDWGWISFYLKEENAWDIILKLTKVDFFLDLFLF